jgi:peptidase inhibitor family I36
MLKHRILKLTVAAVIVAAAIGLTGLGASAASAATATITGSGQVTNFLRTVAPNAGIQPDTGGFVSYADLGRMPASFIREAETGIARLSSASRARAIADLPGSLRAQARQASPTAASAAPAVQNDCNMPGRVCIWQSVGFTGEEGSFSGSNGNWGTDLSGGTQCASGSWNNCVSSIFNNKSADAVNLWETVGDTGGHFCVTPMTGYSDFTKHQFSNSDALNDAVSADFVESGANC